MTINLVSTTDSKDVVLAAMGDKSPKTDVVEQSASDNSEETSDESETSKEDSKETKEVDDSEETLEADSKESDEDKEAQDESDDESLEAKDNQPKKKGGFKKRIERFQRRLSEKETEIEYWKKEALKQKNADQVKHENKNSNLNQDEKKPKADDFESHDAYVEALTDWKLEQREAKKAYEEQINQAKSNQQKQIEAFQSKVTDFSKAHEDFQDLIDEVDDIPLSIGLQESILSCDVGPAVMYELAKDKAELERINKLSPLACAREIGKIEARLTKNSSTKQQTLTTKAPSPVKPVGRKTDKAVRKTIYDPNVSQSEFERLRREQLSHK